MTGCSQEAGYYNTLSSCPGGNGLFSNSPLNAIGARYRLIVHNEDQWNTTYTQTLFLIRNSTWLVTEGKPIKDAIEYLDYGKDTTGVEKTITQVLNGVLPIFRNAFLVLSTIGV